jgi:hypothetical protein
MKELTLEEAALAWAQGKRVEANRKGHDVWTQITGIGRKRTESEYSSDVFAMSDYLFRLAPEPPAKRYRPWTPGEVPVGRLFRKKGFAGVSLILSNGASKESGVSYVGWDNQLAKVRYQDALGLYEHSLDNGKTWLPCGVEVSE